MARAESRNQRDASNGRRQPRNQNGNVGISEMNTRREEPDSYRRSVMKSKVKPTDSSLSRYLFNGEEDAIEEVEEVNVSRKR